jgi:preprotein translocase subunit SecE
MANLKIYLKDTYDELLHKVTWPKWSELQSSAIVVMVASAIIAIAISLMDLSFKEVLGMVYAMFY